MFALRVVRRGPTRRQGRPRGRQAVADGPLPCRCAVANASGKRPEQSEHQPAGLRRGGPEEAIEFRDLLISPDRGRMRRARKGRELLLDEARSDALRAPRARRATVPASQPPYLLLDAPEPHVLVQIEPPWRAEGREERG